MIEINENFQVFIELLYNKSVIIEQDLIQYSLVGLFIELENIIHL
jgi:hypothetical protein